MDYHSCLFIFIFIFIFIFFRVDCSPDSVIFPSSCLGSGNYSTNTLFQANLDSALSSLPSTVSNSGFTTGLAGEAPNQISATALCRADSQLEACRNCISNATSEISQSQYCSTFTSAIFWWVGNCTIHYSNESIFGVLDESVWTVGWNLNVTSNIASEFQSDLDVLLQDLRGNASVGGSEVKVAAGNVIGNNFVAIFGMMQCTPDISSVQCYSCLGDAVGLIPMGANLRKGYRVFSPNCMLRYEIYEFYNLTRIQEVEAMLMPPSSSPPLPSSSYTPSKSGGSKRIVIIVVVVAVVAIMSIIACGFFIRKKLRDPGDSVEIEIGEDDNKISIESLQYDFKKIRAATNDFSEANELGRGGFGSVYKGTLESGEEIAVKRLCGGSSQGDNEFKNEVMLLANLQHRNLVKLYGFCIEGNERILIYEFLRNSSLDRFIFDPIRRSEMDWNIRFNIIEGIARGLLYLHQDSRYRIIHRDLKTNNVLLDSDMNPKIADFGLARLFNEVEGKTSKIVGTYGYMAPEYIRQGQISIKIDVYSFGVMVLEIVSGQSQTECTEDLLSVAWRNWEEGKVEEIIDPILKENTRSWNEILRCIHVGLLCVQNHAVERPTMASVVLMLKSSSITMPLPSRPAFVGSMEVTAKVMKRHTDKLFNLEVGDREFDSSEKQGGEIGDMRNTN